MNFDFSKFTVQDVALEDLAGMKKEMDNKESKLNNKALEIEEIEDDIYADELNEYGKLLKMSWEEKMDYWIAKYKDTPKIMYEDLGIRCTFNDKTNRIIMLNKKTYEIVEFTDKEFYEDAVFGTKTRPEKAKMILDKYKEITGNGINNSFDENRKSLQDDIDDIKIDDDIFVESEDEDSEINIPDDILD